MWIAETKCGIFEGDTWKELVNQIANSGLEGNMAEVTDLYYSEDGKELDQERIEGFITECDNALERLQEDLEMSEQDEIEQRRCYLSGVL